MDASQEEIKRAFRRLALRYHPDVNRKDYESACTQFRVLREAYENLSDPAKRQIYDKSRGYRKTRPCGNRQVRQNGTLGGKNVWSQPVTKIFEEVFNFRVEKFPGIGRNDLRFDLLLPQEMVKGGSLEEIVYERLIFCPRCRGNGSHQARYCEKCNGNGTILTKTNLKIWIPPGSKPGSRFRIAGVGDQLSPTEPPGDLIVVLHISEGS